jgi:hypothetical protein
MSTLEDLERIISVAAQITSKSRQFTDSFLKTVIEKDEKRYKLMVDDDGKEIHYQRTKTNIASFIKDSYSSDMPEEFFVKVFDAGVVVEMHRVMSTTDSYRKEENVNKLYGFADEYLNFIETKVVTEKIDKYIEKIDSTLMKQSVHDNSMYMLTTIETKTSIELFITRDELPFYSDSGNENFRKLISYHDIIKDVSDNILKILYQNLNISPRDFYLIHNSPVESEVVLVQGSMYVTKLVKGEKSVSSEETVERNDSIDSAYMKMIWH